jgi:hypothetical protein
MNNPNASLLYSVLAVSAIVGSFFSPYLSVANGQSPMGMMNGNETDMGQNMSMPQSNLGVVTMPVACTSLGEILGSVTGMTGGGGGDNESQKNIMDMMQKMMSGGDLGGIGKNITGADVQDLQQGMQELKQLDLQGIMNMQLCSLMTNQTMMEEMLMKK